MSRSLLVALLFALLCLSFSSSASAACVNGCSGQGTCVASTWCNCTAGYIGLDCAVKTAMTTPLCWLDGAVCAWWGVQDGTISYRVSASNTTAAGWVGVMWNATDGMSYGQSSIFHIVDGAVAAFDGYNVKKGKPTNLTDQSIAPQNVTGGLTSSGGMEISFARALDTGLPQHYAIPAMKGMPSSWSVAYAQEFWEFHGKNAAFVKSVDIVGLAMGSVSERAEQANYAQNRHNMMGRMMTPQ